MVVADSLIATGLGIAAIGEASGSNDSSSALIPVAIGAAFLGAAIYGYRLTNACDKANADYHLAQLENAEPRPFTAVATPASIVPVSFAPGAVAAPAVVAPAVVAPAVPAPAVVAPVVPRPVPPQPPPPPPVLDDRWPAFWRVLP
jgi:hypothetical protein